VRGLAALLGNLLSRHRWWKSFAKSDIFLINFLIRDLEMARRRYYEFDRFRLDTTGRVLYRQGETVPLPPKVADTLLLLVENAGNVVEKANLLKNIWPDTFVEEGSLTRTISILQKALVEGGEQEYIVTVPKRGYRFASPVKEIPMQPAPSAAERIMLAAQVLGIIFGYFEGLRN
jgi:DNA-binding winged helix-turn-helix (wHTH) protein